MKNIYLTRKQGGVAIVASGIVSMICGRVFLENGDWFFLLVTLIFAWSLIRGIPWFFPTRIIFDRIRFWKQGIIWGRWEEMKVDEIKKISVKHVVAWGASGIFPHYEVGMYDEKNQGILLRCESEEKVKNLLDTLEEKEKKKVVFLKKK